MEKLPDSEMLRLAGFMAQDVIEEVAAAESALALLLHDETVPLDVRGKLSLLGEQVREAALPAQRFLLLAHTQTELKGPGAEAVDPGEYLSDLSQLFRRLCPQNINFRIELDSDLWPVRLTRSFDDALITLIVRARDAMPKGGELLYRAANIEENICRSMTGLCLSGDHVLIEIADSGIAIPPAQLERVFDPFFRTEGPVKGFGLAKAYRTVKNIDGHICAKSERGKGTTFFIFIPRIVTDAFGESQLSLVHDS
jgi:two-component system cell cycle sensor histidine kinase/response regulator CckA